MPIAEQKPNNREYAYCYHTKDTRLNTNIFVRVHTHLAFGDAWEKIWYVLRGLDPKGSGKAEAQIETILELVDRKLSTVYEWLRDAKKAGALRSWRIENGLLTAYYTSLPKLCERLELEDWGAVGEVPLEKIKELRSVAVEVETQSQQEKSEFASKAVLKRRERETVKFYTPKDLIDQEDEPWRGASALQSSLKATFVFRGPYKIFVGEAFVPYGASQAAIAAAVNCSDRTVRRHLEGTAKKQLVQSKPAYSLITTALKHGGIYGGDEETYLTQTAKGQRLFERNGMTSARREGGHPVSGGRIFEYFGQSWIYRCNLYQLDHQLTTMKFAKERFENLMREKERALGKEGGCHHNNNLCVAVEEIKKGEERRQDKSLAPVGH